VKKILLIKTSSLGDVVHNFPVVADIRRRFPQASIDWVVEEAYAPLLALSPGVRRAVPVAIRRWRRRLLGAATWREIGDLRRMLGTERYDEIIDTQGLLKSALIAAAARGTRHGFDADSAREAIAARFYDVVHHVPRAQHAVARNRELAAAAMGYRVREPADYGLRIDRDARNGAPGGIVFLHSTSRADKHWPEAAWIELGRLVEAQGHRVVLPWGTEAERERSRRIAAGLRQAHVPRALAMREMTDVLALAEGVVGVDTGLMHLAAAMGTPVAAVYCATDPRMTGIYGCERSVNLGGPGRPPVPQEVFDALRACGAL
jgi:heptosyltransferase I